MFRILSLLLLQGEADHPDGEAEEVLLGEGGSAGQIAHVGLKRLFTFLLCSTVM